MKKIPNMRSIYSLLMLAVPLYAYAHGPGPGDQALPGKQKNISKVFSMHPTDQLLVSNQYGDVKVRLWDKKEVRIDVVILASAPSSAQAEEYVNAVRIGEVREGSLVTIKTEINRRIFGTGWRPWRDHAGVRNALRIDYTVSMPRDIPLAILNKFGDIRVPHFQAVLKVESSYGNFYAETLENLQNSISIAYGSATIKKMDGGTLQSDYADLRLDRAGTLRLFNKFGRLNIGEINNLMAHINYSTAHIESLTEKAKVKLNFSKNFMIRQCSADDVDIDASYSSVYLPAEPGRFTVTVNHGQFNYPDNGNILLIHTEPVQGRPAAVRQYEGKIGTPPQHNTPRLKVISRYGNVNLRE